MSPTEVDSQLLGHSRIAGRPVPGTGPTFEAVDPATGEALPPAYRTIGSTEVDAAVDAATAAFAEFRHASPEQRAGLLRLIADNIDAVNDELVDRARRETGLPEGRLYGEVSRTSNQLRLLAGEVELGEHQGVRIDHAQPDRSPVPAPDLRLRFIPLGPVVVFGASNFPMAFSTAGGDTASALAAGCPVIVKAHPAHPGTAELTAIAVDAAIAACGLPRGLFSVLYGVGNDLGAQLVTHPGVRAVGFTGSRAGGMALSALAQSRPVPIPVYAEMSSVNPVVVLPHRARAAADVAQGYVDSLTLGSGQFCTNPGLLFVPRDATDLRTEIGQRITAVTGQPMLTSRILSSYNEGAARFASLDVLGSGSPGDGPTTPIPTVATVSAKELRLDHTLADEVFGPAGLVVTYTDLDDLQATLDSLAGQLTVAVHADPADHDAVAALLPRLEDLAGRVIMNAWPTGVEVTHAMVHGGPFPATTAPGTTSVGTLAIQRFQRPVSYQGFPQELLPAAVREDNPWQLPRRTLEA
ncbi:aldehyde dehydrogenase (NADP(+)) [Microlunatus sp. Y2014]|uniref:aldehyde dehydrogenase (NADP(+)) n=1 Tax=Microlunatus sp. Y2014 TaxID=3418488 RepID=UPI003DA72173